MPFWYHNKCTGMNDILYRVHMEHESYTCHGSVIDVACQSYRLYTIWDPGLSTSNSFDVLANLNSESLNEVPITPNFSNGHIGSPKHTSSPTKSNKTSGKKSNSSRNNRGKPTQRRLKLMNINFQSIRNKIPAFQTLVEKENQTSFSVRRLG